MNHEINLTGYTATCGETNNMLDLGTAGSYGLEKLHVTADAAWDGLTITATFTNSGSTTVAVSDGTVDVPPEATRLPTRDRVRYGMLAFKGVDANGKLRIISTPICYKVQASAATDGSNTIDPTPDQYAQFVAEVMAEADRAEAAADRAESAGGNVTPEQIAAAVNNYLTENPVQPTPIDATLTQSGQAADAKAVGDAIADIELTPGPAGANGTNGKSAYQYAQEGGYTGTEEEFAAKMAEEMPDNLPNPNALTFTGAVTGTYDGSESVTVNIPSGGSSGGSVSANIEKVYSWTADGTVQSNLDSLAIEPNKIYFCELLVPSDSSMSATSVTTPEVYVRIGTSGNTYTGCVVGCVKGHQKYTNLLSKFTFFVDSGIIHIVLDRVASAQNVPTISNYTQDQVYIYSTTSDTEIIAGTTVNIYKMG